MSKMKSFIIASTLLGLISGCSKDDKHDSANKSATPGKKVAVVTEENLAAVKYPVAFYLELNTSDIQFSTATPAPKWRMYVCLKATDVKKSGEIIVNLSQLTGPLTYKSKVVELAGDGKPEKETTLNFSVNTLVVKYEHDNTKVKVQRIGDALFGAGETNLSVTVAKPDLKIVNQEGPYQLSEKDLQEYRASRIGLTMTPNTLGTSSSEPLDTTTEGKLYLTLASVRAGYDSTSVDSIRTTPCEGQDQDHFLVTSEEAAKIDRQNQ